MYPSNLFALTDLMIDTPFISQLMSINMKIEDYYAGKIKIDERYDIFLTDEATIKQYPKTLILFGSTDPIRDESYRLADFLL
jgi:acetyl esterase/lipase